MKKIVLVLCLIGALSARAQELKNTAEPAFQIGEELRYKLKYGIFTAAEASLKISDTDLKFDDRPVFHLVAEGRTSGTFDFFHKVRNRYDSYIDKKELTPYLYTENIHESNYRRSDKARFYQDQKKVISNKGTFNGNVQTFDVISAYYFARNLDMTKVTKGQKFTMSYFLSDGISQLDIEYVGKEVVKTALGTFSCLKFSPSIEPGRIFRKDSKLYLWITDDGNRIPVKAHVEVLVGSITMELTDAKGLKFPLLAKREES
ncbi:MAG: DUF3108 domain-containing protein [Sphingobacteriaceae bacterium]